MAGFVDSTDDGFGQNDALITGDTTPGLLATIGQIDIGGEVDGTAGGGDHFGFVAETIAKARILDADVEVNAADNILLDLVNGDVRLVDTA